MNRQERRRAWASVNQREYGFSWKSFNTSFFPHFPSLAEQIQRCERQHVKPEDGSPGYGYTDRDM